MTFNPFFRSIASKLRTLKAKPCGRFAALTVLTLLAFGKLATVKRARLSLWLKELIVYVVVISCRFIVGKSG